MNKADKPTVNKWEAIAKESDEDVAVDQVDSEPESTVADVAPEEEPEATDTEALLKKLDNGDDLIVGKAHPDEMRVLEDKLTSTQAALLSVQADMSNLRKRTERDVINAHKYANEKLIQAMLPVLDSLERGLEGETPESPEAQAAVEGVRLTLELLLIELAKFGLQVIAPEEGTAFNPDRHEAISMQPDTGLPSQSVVKVVQKGYSLNDRVVRAAMVLIAA